jgi:AcrR family transcriptional regulator
MAVRAKALEPLSSTAIVDAALAIADAEGIAALSMRRVATALSCAPMSLYEHVANKEALLDLMADQAMASLPELRPGAPWQREMTRFFTAFHELFLEHPAVAHVMVARPLSGPVALRRGEPAFAVLVAAGFTDAQAVEAFIALASYTIGASLYELARRETHLRDTRFDDLVTVEHPLLVRLAPHLHRSTGGQQFRRGLRHLLDSYQPGRR